MGTEAVGHTPGPWRVGTEDHTAILSPGGLRAATAHGLGRDNTDANARLIAAAPDLLAACRKAAQLIEDLNAGDGPLMGNTFDKLAAAIAKAEGGAA